MPSGGRNCYSLLRLKLISRSPLWLGSKIRCLSSRGTEFDPRYNINLRFVPKCQSNIHIIYTYTYILLRIEYDRHRNFHFGRAVVSTQNIFFLSFLKDHKGWYENRWSIVGLCKSTLRRTVYCM